MQHADVFVIGGGPAGLVAAIAARQRGLSVVLADGAEPPIDKPCGEGLMPETQHALRDLGIELSPRIGYRFRGVQFLQEGARVAGDFPDGEGVGIRRPLLHELLVAKAEEFGVRMLWKTTVSGIAESGVQTARGFVKARWILGADGSGSRVRKWSGLEATRKRKQRYAMRRHYRVKPWSNYLEIYWGDRAQAYVTPIGEEEVCIVVMAENSHDAEFGDAMESLPELRERLLQVELASRERGAMTAMHVLRRVTMGNVALVGDASGGVDAITGGGLNLAFRQSLAVAAAMDNGDLSCYEETHRQLAQRPLQMGNLLLFLGRNKTVRRRSLQAMAAQPELFENLLAMHVGQITPARILSTGLHLGWQFLAA